MKYISVRSLVKEKKLQEFSDNIRPLTYVTILRRVNEHIEQGNQLGIIMVGTGKSVRYAIEESKVDGFVEFLRKHYSRD